MKKVEDCKVVSGVGELCPGCPILSLEGGEVFDQTQTQGFAIDRRNHMIMNPVRFENPSEPATRPYAKAAEACLRHALELDVPSVLAMLPEPEQPVVINTEQIVA